MRLSQGIDQGQGIEFRNGFLHIGHCDFEIPQKLVLASPVRAHIEEAARFFSDEPITEISAVGPKSSNSQNYLCTTWSHRAFLLRQCLGQTSEEYLSASAEMLTLAHERGAPVAKPLRATNDSWATGVHPGERWIAFEYLPAQFYYSGQGDQVRQVGEAIGRMHAVMSQPDLLGVVKSFESRTAVVFDPLTEGGLNRALKAAEREEPDSRITKLFQAEFEHICAAVKAQGKASRTEMQQAQTGTIHYDLHPHNLLVQNGRISIVDYDNFRTGPLAQDVGFALHRLIRQACYHHGRENVAAYVESFMQGYGQGNPGAHIDAAHIVAHGMDRTLMSLAYVLEGYFVKRDLTLAPLMPKFLLAQREVLYILNSSPRFSDFLS